MSKMDFVKNIKPKAKNVAKHFLFSSDSLEILKQIPDNSIRLVITDPPYNIGLSYNRFKDKNL